MAVEKRGRSSADKPSFSANPKTGKPLRPRKGLDKDRLPVFISYDQTERLVASLLDRVALWSPDAVAGIARGGLVPATMASCMLALPLFMIGWDRASGGYPVDRAAAFRRLPHPRCR
jgi:hypothetical protein